MIEDENFEKMVKDLQRKIEYEEEKTYSRKVISEYRNPNNFGAIEDPEATGEVKGSCGDTMKITLRIENGIIQNACFWTDGCGATIACGNMLTKMIRGKTPDEAAGVSNEKLIEALDVVYQRSISIASSLLLIVYIRLLKITIKTRVFE